MKKYLFFVVVAVLFAGCDSKPKANMPEGMDMESYANYKKLGFSDEKIAENYEKKKKFYSTKPWTPPKLGNNNKQ